MPLRVCVCEGETDRETDRHDQGYTPRDLSDSKVMGISQRGYQGESVRKKTGTTCSVEQLKQMTALSRLLGIHSMAGKMFVGK